LHLNHSSAYLLVTHGSRDPRPQKAIAELALLVAQQLTCYSTQANRSDVQTTSLQESAVFPASHRQITVLSNDSPLIGTAVLELHPLPLHQQIQQFADQARQKGCQHLQIIPLFLLPGVHVMEDIPTEVGLAQATLGTSMLLELRPYLGSHGGLLRLLTVPPSSPIPTGHVLIAHGSRRPKGNKPVEAIATQLGVLAAYWSVPPTLQAQIVHLIEQGCQRICIHPYFLFSGKVTDAIAQAVEALAGQFPEIQFQCLSPLETSDALARLVIDLMA